MTLGIEVERLELRYGSVTALDGLSFSLPGGRIYGLLGRTARARPACCRCWPRSARRRQAGC
jgi:ABC-2 type transport system ATP-binding protein